MQPAPGTILVDRDLAALLGTALVSAPDAPAPERSQVQPASVDLRLGPRLWRIRGGFLPERTSVEDRLAELATDELDLSGDGAVLERGRVYLARLDDELALPPELAARFNPRSTTGRCDVFTRVLVPGHPRFDEAPHGYRGALWLEIAPLSFPVRLRRGDRLCQARLQTGAAGLTAREVRELWATTPLCTARENGRTRPLTLDEVRLDDEGRLELRLGLAGRDPCGWRAARETDVVELGGRGVHDPGDFWEPVRARDGRLILEPGRFHVFASRERVLVPPHLAAEVHPVDPGLGELRNNYAGFFDCGFGWVDPPASGGTPAVLEVRAHDVPFLVEDGQVFFRMQLFRTRGVPDRLYGEGREGPSYRDQDLTLARPFR